MTLTQAATIVRQLITVSAISMMLLVVGFIGYRIWYAYYLASIPPVEEKADLKFGMLPGLVFPSTVVTSSNFSYSLDTITGGLPKAGVDPGFEKFVKVYFVTQSVASLLSPERAEILAEKFGLINPPEVLSTTKYKYSSENRNLLIDLNTGNFSYTKEASISARIELDDDNSLVSGFKQILSNLEVLKDNLNSGRTKVTLLKPLGETLIPTQLRSEATAAQISLWPQAVDKKTVFTADYNRSLVSSIVTGPTNSLDNYHILDFIYFPIDQSTFATYPLKTADIAFDDLKSGKGVVIMEPNEPKVSISSVYLGYYLQEDYSPYLQPIYVFEGANFVAYVSAIPSEFQSSNH